ncbi:MAG: hypothetical protein WAX89_07890 [Alphaproteobacteria bacterium]
MQIQLPQNLTSARDTLAKGMNKQTAKLEEAAKEVLRAADKALEPTPKAKADVNASQEMAQIANMNKEAMLSAKEPELASSMVKMVEAKHAYKAAAKATQVVNDVERQTIESVRKNV